MKKREINLNRIRTYIYVSLRHACVCTNLFVLFPAAPASPPRNVRVQSQEPGTIVVEWEEPEIPNGIIQVRLYWRRV